MSTQIGMTHAEQVLTREAEAVNTTESIAGAVAAILAILGLIGLLPQLLGSIATIAAGVAMLVAGSAVAAHYTRVMSGTERTQRSPTRGLRMEALTALGAIVLGVLALLGIDSMALLSISAIVLGGALLMVSDTTTRLEAVMHTRPPAAGSEHRHEEAPYVSAGSDILVGTGAIVLGILGLAGHAPITLALIAFLSVGAVLVLNGSTIATRFFGALS